MNLRSRQRGIALIYVLLIFAMITLMASQIVTSLWLHTEKNTRYLERTQSKHYALGAENYVALLLEHDAESDKKNRRQIDHMNESWNVDSVDFDIEQGDIEITIIDEQSRFNLNWLADNDGGKGRSGAEKQVQQSRIFYQDNQYGSTNYLEMLKNLLLSQALDPQLSYKIKDWLDSDQNSAEAGAEDIIYQSSDQPRRTADTAMASISELKLIDGIGDNELEKLIPLITALPKSSKINLNTALPAVIQSISKNLTDGDAQAIIDARGDQGIESMAALNNLSSMKGKSGLLQRAPVEFGSNYFSVYIKATYRGTTFYMKTSLVRNGEGQVQVAGREIGPSSYWAITKKEPEE
ncbi:hypothetical protein ACH42_12785 [Endozoicomonas sp. (ex Bugula neritina AB1)]|nr:hypothetical protein ACH42_12785 [Endozoicomonas sp. (ex Bugula neritina AB1)]